MSSSDSKHSLPGYLLLPGIVMSLGWGLRGFIGGGPLGAMIPGALVALALSFLLGNAGGRPALLGVFGAIGVGFGGQETYGQAVQFISRPEMFALGMTGMAVKGAVWGLVGGACIGIGMTFRPDRRRPVLLALVLLVVGTFVGWKFIDDPKLIYFSNLQDRPRAELWAGLLTGGVFMLLGLAWFRLARFPVRFALAGAIGGGIGFPLGGVLMLAGRALPLAKTSYPGWKLMEFTFGLCLGLALGWCAYMNRQRLADAAHATAPAPTEKAASPAGTLLAAILAVGVVWAGNLLPLRFGYTVGGAVVLGWSLFSGRAAWQGAITVTVWAFTLYNVGFLEEQLPGQAVLGWCLLAGICGVTIWFIGHQPSAREAQVRRALLFLMWSAVLAAYWRTALYGEITLAQVTVAVVFAVLALAATFIVVRRPAGTSSR